MKIRVSTGLTFALGVLVVVTGCREDSAGKLAVSGTIRLDDQPVKSGVISFAPQKSNAESASASFRDGSFKIAASKGLLPGKYVVKIFSEAVEPQKSSPEDLMTYKSRQDDSSEPPQQTIPPEYNSASTLIVEVKKSEVNEFKFELESSPNEN